MRGDGVISKDKDREYENCAHGPPGFRTMIRSRIPPLVGLPFGNTRSSFLQVSTNF